MKFNVFASRHQFYTMTVEAPTAEAAREAARGAADDQWTGEGDDEGIEIEEVVEADPGEEAHWRVGEDGDLEPYEDPTVE